MAGCVILGLLNLDEGYGTEREIGHVGGGGSRGMEVKGMEVKGMEVKGGLV